MKQRAEGLRNAGGVQISGCPWVVAGLEVHWKSTGSLRIQGVQKYSFLPEFKGHGLLSTFKAALREFQ